MDMSKFKHWIEMLASSGRRPAYLYIPDIISDDIDTGVLKSRERLPTIRTLAAFLNLDYTTVARAFKEARRQGLIESSPGSGSFVKGRAKTMALQGGSNFEMTMNLPPEPRLAQLSKKIHTGIETLSKKRDLHAMFRYQDFGGSENARLAGVKFLETLIDKPQVDQVLVCPGIHSALVGLMSLLAVKGSTVCVEGLVYPGLKAIAAQLGVTLTSVSSDNEGPVVREMKALLGSKKVAAIYLNPTLQNPTTRTISLNRRKAIAELSVHYSVPIIEDDAYALLCDEAIPPIATFSPELTYYISGFSKCFGAGLRTAYLYAPSKLLAQRAAGALRALSVMASPITNALATDWIHDGTLWDVIGGIKEETSIRQAYASKYLGDFIGNNNLSVFHLWLNLPKKIEMNPTVLAAHLRENGVNAVSSAAFCTNNNPENAIRIGLGGSLSRSECEDSLKLVADIFEHPLHLTNVAF